MFETTAFCTGNRKGCDKDVRYRYCICGSVNSKEKDSRTKARREKVDRTKMYIWHRKKRTIDQR